MATNNEVAEKAATKGAKTADKKSGNKETIVPEKKTASKSKAPKIGFVSFSEEDQRHKDLKAGMYERMQDPDYAADLIVNETPMDAKSQLAAINEVIEAGAKGLLLTPFEDDSIINRINELTKEGIPVVTVCSDIEGTDRLAYVGSNNMRLGHTVGALLGLICAGRGEVGIVTGSRKVLGQEQRIAGFMEKIKKEYPNIEVETIVECKNGDYKTYDTLQRIAYEYPTITSFIFVAGGVGGGCKALYQMTGTPDYNVITIDEIEATVEYMDKGIITAAICQEPNRQGAIALTILLDKVLRGKDPEAELNYTDINIKIKENI